MKFDGFDWDEGNKTKIRQHGLDPDLVERFFQGKLWIGPDIKHSQKESRFMAIGQIETRYVLIAFTIREKETRRLVRPISARPMHNREIGKYEEEIAKI